MERQDREGKKIMVEENRTLEDVYHGFEGSMISRLKTKSVSSEVMLNYSDFAGSAVI
jgi:hypothetical protein